MRVSKPRPLPAQEIPHPRLGGSPGFPAAAGDPVALQLDAAGAAAPLSVDLEARCGHAFGKVAVYPGDLGAPQQPGPPPEGTGGQPLDQPTRLQMERTLGHSFGRVSIHPDGRAGAAARGLGTRAFTIGSDVYFGEGHYRPDTRDGRRLLAHELTHVAQNESHRPSPSRLLSQVDDAAEVEAGEGAVTAGVAVPDALIQREPPTPSNIAAPPPKPLKHRYQRSGYKPSTGIGHFDELEYNSETQVLTITIKPHFEFAPFVAGQYPPEVRAQAAAQYEQKKRAYVTSFVQQAEAWGGHHVFFCHEPGLEHLRSQVRVEVEVQAERPSSAEASYTPVSAPASAYGQNPRSHKGGSITADIDEGSRLQHDPATNQMVPKPIGPPLDLRGLGEHGATPGGPPGLPEPAKQPYDPNPTFQHEIGHVFGLGDEYAKEGNQGTPTEHSGLAQSMLGVTVKHGGNPDSIMAGGATVLPQHGVTFLDALRALTGMEWEFEPKKVSPG